MRLCKVINMRLDTAETDKKGQKIYFFPLSDLSHIGDYL